ncbi:beta-propeller domain-containing protein [Alteromonas gilva]|uniref:Beta-propeller domain-containing protein n=1 Tax=Alteromonas gilva TaxID=2987522 RepID=A0ABT5L407_9ALTE|nr:beta-propeller domain-containing protein [Alteromonas gilva]MDC8831587.1 beta-propeller domain-containing protein [Alteromonas gilva]
MMNASHRTDLMWKYLAVSIFSTSAIIACGNDSESTPGSITSPPQLSFMPASGSALTASQDVSPGQYVKNGLYLMQLEYQDPTSGGDADAPEFSASDNYSTTNNQIDGVDEADRIEYNGEYFFVADVPIWTEETGLINNVRILRRLDDFSLSEAANIPLQPEFNVSGMYLYSDTLGVVSHTYQYATMAGALEEDSPWQRTDNDIIVDVYDVTDPASPVSASQIRIDGGLISSRRIDNNLFIATQYVPNVSGLPNIDDTDKSLIKLYQSILNVAEQDLVPKVTINGQSSELFQLDDCLIPEAASRSNGHAQMVSLVKIDLDNPANITAECLLTEARGLFMSASNVYLHADFDQNTVFHKLSLGDEIRYEASGSVAGQFSWRSAPQFKMAERDGKFIAVTTTDMWSTDRKHALHVLDQQGSELVAVTSLPNASQPAPIGKPGEDIYAVRFFADKAYVVTFARIDPLYVIDLGDVSAPFIAGELEIPGFSNYLHPMENGLLLGVGQQVSSDGLPVSGSQPLLPVVVEGMKISLFDVLDPANPIVLGELVWTDAYTPVEFDHRALSVLKTDQGYRFALPSETWLNNEDGWYAINALNTIEVNTTQRTLTLRNNIELNPGEDEYFGTYQDRSVLHDDHVYYLHGNVIYHALWQASSSIDGPY